MAITIPRKRLIAGTHQIIAAAAVDTRRATAPRISLAASQFLVALSSSVPRRCWSLQRRDAT
jgi:hypothetical protein